MLKGVNEYCAESPDAALSGNEIKKLLDMGLEQIYGQTEVRRVLLVPPDITRLYSHAGEITRYLYENLTKRGYGVGIMPALGTHRGMTREEQLRFFGSSIPGTAYLEHDWKQDTVKLGTIPASLVRRISGGLWETDIDCEVNRRLTDKSFDLIISIGQVVPHEVVGMANYSKNILVGLGGQEMINCSHIIGALYDMERIMGRMNTPVRELFDYAQEHFLDKLPILYIYTVTTSEGHEAAVHGIYMGASRRAYEHAAGLSETWNITRLPQKVRKVVTYLDPAEFTSTWVGDKAIYRTRRMIEDGGQLVILAPGLRRFGENEETDTMIRRYGYRGLEYISGQMRQGAFDDCLAVAAHLIHGSVNGRFSVTYCTDPEYMTKEEMESVNYQWMDIGEAVKIYDMDQLKEGFNQVEGEIIYVVKSPALGLWTAD